MNKTSPMQSKPLVDVTCKLGAKGCFEDGRCHALGNCENKIVTNADRIRAMSDEELAEFLAEEAFRIAKPVFDAFGWGVKKQVVCSQKLKWLKQPAEEDA